MNNVKKQISKYTGHDHVALLTRGNAAILEALKISMKISGKKTVLIPDQGGWLTYSKYPKKLGLDIVELKTDNGLFYLNSIKENSGSACCLLYENPAGYFAEQDIKTIYDNCKCTVICDVSGCIGDKELCDGRYADIMIGSFGRWKPINVEYGGFISVKEKYKRFLPEDDFDAIHYSELMKKLDGVGKRLEFFYATAEKVKKELNDYDIVHRDKKGINVIVKYKDDIEKQEIISYCESNKYEFTRCPRYIRITDEGVSIEIKRL